MKGLAFDQASAITGWAIGDDRQNSRYLHGTIRTPKRDNFAERLKLIFEGGVRLIETHRPDIIGFEEPYFPPLATEGARPSFIKPRSLFTDQPTEEDDQPDLSKYGNKVNQETLKQLQQVKGVVTLLAALYSIPCVGCTSSQWRKTVLGFGRAPKNEREKPDFKKLVRTHFERLGYVIRTNDESDALGILKHLLHGPDAVSRAQGDLLSMAGGLL